MKSPSMGSIRVDLKEKTAEFEGEEIEREQESDKKKPPNRARSVNKNKFNRKRSLANNDDVLIVVKRDDIPKINQLFNFYKQVSLIR